MNDADKLALCRAIVNQSTDAVGWSDEILQSYITIAGQKIINRAYPYDNTVTEVPSRYGVLQCEIAAYLLNKRGAEGEMSHTENGISRAYENADVPSSMLAVVTPYCGVI